MKIRSIIIGIVLTLSSVAAMAQGGAPVHKLNATLSGTTLNISSNDGCFLTDDDGVDNNFYTPGTDYWVTICTSCEAPNVMSVAFNQFDIYPGDTLYIYDGVGITGVPVLTMANNNLNPLLNHNVYPSLLNTTGCLTFRLKANPQPIGDTNWYQAKGFSCYVVCKLPCEVPTPHIDSMYVKYRNGVPYDTAYIRPFITYDTVINVDLNGNPDTVLQPNIFRGINLCQGEDVMFYSHGTYTNEHGFYYPTDATTMFRWNLGNGQADSLIGGRTIMGRYRDLDCYDVTLQLMDEQGCYSTILETVRVRVAQNPIKTLFDLATICNSDSLGVNVGYEGENGTITLKHINFEKMKSKAIDCKTFIPDGLYCDNPCFTADILFDEFPAGRTVTSKADICSICINMEHSFPGDLEYSIVCPTGQKSVLKFKNSSGSGIPEGAGGGGSTYYGYPYGGQNDSGYDEEMNGNNCPPTQPNCMYCDSLPNMYGIGQDYCFSRNENYTLINGDPANTVVDDAAQFIAYNQSTYVDQVTYTFPTIPSPFYQAGITCGTSTFNLRRPSNHEEKYDYYKPGEDFSQLVGCPLNGNWSIEVCDTWKVDNGWIFNWALDICGISSGVGCEYQVGLDSIKWIPDSTYGDWDLGYYRGLHIKQVDSVNSWIMTPDTAGTFPILVTLYDEFGCVWDSTTRITTIWTPKPHLRNDTSICDIQTLLLDAKDRHTAITNQTFKWSPFGETTDTISTTPMRGTSTLYTVEVENNQEKVTCTTRDSVRIEIYPQPLPNFDPGIYPLEGCEPFTVHFNNMSQNGDYHYWIFGDGDTSTAESPTHTYGTGQYDFKYFISSEYGCKDSLVYEDLITVYSSPVAKFSWEPMNPTVLHPSVEFKNLTVPQSDDNEYYWEIQYDKDNHVSYHTMKEVNPSFEWYTDGEDISGNYIARLIAKTENRGPSGNIVECRDTIENTILLVNDFLQFPTAVTPNGDGINDRFEIKNLVHGLGYPNNSLAIYDRWGKRVYYKENIASEEDFWDPAADNIPAGTYFWRFVGKGYLGDIQRNGSVEVIK